MTMHGNRSALGISLACALLLCVVTPMEARRGTEPMSAAQRFSMPDTPEDGPWSAKEVFLTDTPQAAQVVRVGDIDNFGFGWQAGASPYQGRALRPRPPLWTNPEPEASEDPPGTDVLMAGSGLLPETNEAAPGTAARHAVESVALEFDFLPSVDAGGPVLLQLYLAGFEAAQGAERYHAAIGGESAPFLEEALNRIDIPDTGGRLLTVAVPREWEAVFRAGRFSLRIDKRGGSNPQPDLFAVDFARLLIDPTEAGGEVPLSGQLLPAHGHRPVEGAEVRYQGRIAATDARGRFTFENPYAGLGLLEASHTDGTSLRAVVSIQAPMPGKHVTLRMRNEITKGGE